MWAFERLSEDHHYEGLVNWGHWRGTLLFSPLLLSLLLPFFPVTRTTSTHAQIQGAWVSASKFTSCVIMVKLIEFSKPEFPHLKDR